MKREPYGSLFKILINILHKYLIDSLVNKINSNYLRHSSTETFRREKSARNTMVSSTREF